jgi:hypothetical protein
MRTRPLAVALITLSACGPAVIRDLMEIPQQRVTYDDMCGLQGHFDQRAQGRAAPYRVLNETSNETTREEPDQNGQMRRVVLGEGTYVVAARTDRRRFRSLLRDEYRRLPHVVIGGDEGEVRVRVGWWQSGSIRRVRPDVDIELTAANGNTVTLPPHPCVGEFLFGDESYAMRRNIMAAESARARGEIPAAYLHADGGADGGADAVASPSPAP